tara:strand:- start:326 stop:499 length:174 start_codon:yes stop_codon:yes gene_type:complete
MSFLEPQASTDFQLDADQEEILVLLSHVRESAGSKERPERQITGYSRALSKKDSGAG